MPDQRVTYVVAEMAEDGSPSSLSLELLGLACDLASRLGGTTKAVILGDGVGGAAEELSSRGASEVFAADNRSLDRYSPELYLAVLEGFFGERSPGTVLCGHTPAGQDLMPRLACALGSGLVTDCVGVDVDGREPVFIKPVFGGNAIASFEINTPLKLATVRARVGTAPPRSPDPGEVSALESPDNEPVLVLGERVREETSLRLDEAKVVVSGGRGIGGPEGFESLKELADILGGAVGASRPPCDSGWVPSTNQVGITGVIVAPDLYIAVAISGSSQHLSGMSESAKIVAINNDPGAYIFKVADYGAVGDWKKVLPSFAGKLNEVIDS